MEYISSGVMLGIHITILRRFLSIGLVLIGLGNSALPASTPPGPESVLDLAGTHKVDIWNSDHGLSRDLVWTVFRSSDGYLWIGLDDGAVRFDGSRFAMFDAVTTDGAIDYIIRAFAEGRDGAIWLGTQGGGLIRYLNGELTSLSIDQGIPHDTVLAIEETRDGNLWVGTEGGGLAKLGDGAVAVLSEPEGLPSRFVKALLEDSRGTLWVGTYDGLARVDPVQMTVLETFTELEDRHVTNLAEGTDGTLWIATQAGLLRMRDGRIDSAGVTADIVHDVKVDDQGVVWAVGLGLFRIEGDAIRRYGTADGFPKEHMLSIAPGDEGSIWVGSMGGGLNRLRPSLFRVLGTREGLSEDYVTTVHHNREGFWIGTWGGALNRFHDGRLSVERVKDSPVADYITCLFTDSKGTFWVGTSGGGLRKRLAGGGYRSYTREDGLSHMAATAVGEDRDGNLWVGTGDTLERMSGDRFVTVETPEALDHNMVHVIFTDSRGDLWVGREWGLIRIGREGMEVFREKDGLTDDTVYALHEDREGDLWIGTAGGLSRLRNGIFESLKRKDGLPDSSIFTILEDDRDHLWMSSNRGVIRIARSRIEAFWRGETDRIHASVYGRPAGMRTNECSGGIQPAGLVDDDGRFWFATVQGLVTVHPVELKPPRRPPRTVLEEALVDRRPVSVYSDVEVPRGDGELEFRYAAVSLQDASDIRFRYRLDGFDETWREAGSQQIARYTNVPPGRYRFRVAASHGAGPWGEDEAALAVILAPRFYQRKSFLAALILGAMLAGGSGYTLWTRQARARQRRLEQLVAERTRGLKEATRQLEGLTRRQSDFVTGISHELKTPLTLIRLYAETLLTNAGSPEEKRIGFYRIIVREVERLTRLVDRVLDFSRIEHGVKKYEMGNGNLADAVARTAAAYKPYLQEEGFTLRMQIDRSVPTVDFDADAISMAVINLLENASKYSGDSDTIDLRVATYGSGVAIEVEDRGIGIPAGEQERIFERFYRVASDSGSGDYGIGLYVVREVINAHGGSVVLESEPGRGSTFRLVIPSFGSGGAE